MPTDTVEYALLHPEGQLEFAHAPNSDSLVRTMRDRLPELGTQGVGRLRAWFADDFGALPPNPLADAVLAGVGYHHPTGWHGPVGLSMEEDQEGIVASLDPNVRTLIEDLAHAR